MIAKLISFIVTLVIFVLYVGFNLDNRCDIWLFFKILKDVPVFMNTIISFVCGVLFAIPFMMFFKMKKNKNDDADKKTKDRIKNLKKPNIVYDKNAEDSSNKK